MNELLANLLNQYSENNEDYNMLHLSSEETPHLTSLPAQIRNLAPPIRFFSIPDLDLDMDLDTDNLLRDLAGPATQEVSFAASDLDDASGLAVSSELDGDFEHNETNSDNSSDNLDDDEELEADDDEDDDDVDSDLGQTGIFHRIQTRRLLLSSARQNLTNRNTLINSGQGNSTRVNRLLGGVPLTRLNAIRLKHRQPANANLENLARDFHGDFEAAITAIKSLDSFVGKSPLFANHPHSESCLSVRKWSSLRRLVRKTSFELNMDRFLNHRRRGTLWTQKTNRCGEARGHEMQRKVPESKRKHLGSSGNQKRRKVSNKQDSRHQARFMAPPALPMGGESISYKFLSRDDKYKILDGLPCSFLQNGSTFALDLLVRGRDSIDLSFSNVDLEEKKLHGYFSVQACGERSGHIHLIIGFLSFLCGGIRSRYTINCTNKVLQTKSALLDHTFMEAIVERGLSSPQVVECLTSMFHIPFSGDIVDFNKNDLRFLQETRPVSPKTSFSRSMHVSRLRNEQIKMQLCEWLRIRPFHNFSEAFFLNYLFFVEKYLRDFKDTANIEQELGIEFARNMKDLIHDITRDFDFVRDAKIPMVEEKGNQAKKDIWERRRHEPRSNLQKSSFLREWESKICEKLSDYVTCEDSCLCNIQLNYVLFTVKVDVSAALDQTFEKFINLVTKDSERNMLQKKYNAISKEQLLPDAKECVFVCSLNRKTGRLEMQNTRLNLDYKYAGSCDARGSLLRNSFGNLAGGFTQSDEEDNSGPMGRFSAFSTHWKYLEDPQLMDNPTVTMGKWKRGSCGTSSSGGIGRADFV